MYVLNQDEAYDFYVNKLGFKVIIDMPMGPNVRWLTVSPKEQEGIEINLFPLVEGQMFDAETLKTMRELVQKGTFGAAVFECNDIYATYEELKSKGVIFKKSPTKEFYGIEALFQDNSGNWFSLGQKK